MEGLKLVSERDNRSEKTIRNIGEAWDDMSAISALVVAPGVSVSPVVPMNEPSDAGNAGSLDGSANISSADMVDGLGDLVKRLVG